MPSFFVISPVPSFSAKINVFLCHALFHAGLESAPCQIQGECEERT
jgi:hypothetical protein